MCPSVPAGTAARNAAINACNMPWIRALQLFELESADLITYNTAIEASDWQQAGEFQNQRGMDTTILLFVLLPMVFFLATSLVKSVATVSSELCCLARGHRSEL